MTRAEMPDREMPEEQEPGSTASLLLRVREGSRPAREELAGRYLTLLNRWAHGRVPRAARDLMDRFGFPRLAQQQHFGDFPAKLFDLTAPEPPRDQPPAGDGGVSTGNGADLSTPH